MIELDPDDGSPICPACGVTMFLNRDEPEPRYVCLECGFEPEHPPNAEPSSSSYSD